MSGAHLDFALSESLAVVLAGAPVRVGTENAAKLGAVREALSAHAPSAESLVVLPSSVSSDVPDQPVGWKQITDGARNRAQAAFAFQFVARSLIRSERLGASSHYFFFF